VADYSDEMVATGREDVYRTDAFDAVLLAMTDSRSLERASKSPSNQQ
jgi:hypothetical protein